MTENKGTGYTAAICLGATIVEGQLCDVFVAENDAEGNMGNNVVMPTQEITVRVIDDDRFLDAPPLADAVLAANGWTRTEDWEEADDVMYAQVEMMPGE